MSSKPQPRLSDKRDTSARFYEWFGGEFDNHEQVWQQEVDEISEADRHEHIHHIFLPVSVPALGDRVFFVKQYSDNDPENIYRLRLYQFAEQTEDGAIKLTIHRFTDEAPYKTAEKDPSILVPISAGELSNQPGCEVYWHWEVDHFVGKMEQDACNFFSQRSNKRIYINDTLKLTSDSIHIADRATDEHGNKVFGRDEPHVNRKVAYYEGWVSFIPARVFDGSQDEEWKFIRLPLMHNEGDIHAVVHDGRDTGYSIELARLTYQNTKTPILKLGLIDNETGKTITYIWGGPQAERLGMNLRWFQVGLKKSDQKFASGDADG